MHSKLFFLRNHSRFNINRDDLRQLFELRDKSLMATGRIAEGEAQVKSSLGSVEGQGLFLNMAMAQRIANHPEGCFAFLSADPAGLWAIYSFESQQKTAGKGRQQRDEHLMNKGWCKQ